MKQLFQSSRFILRVIISVFFGHSLSAANMNEMNHGPFASWTIRGATTTYKGIAIRIGDDSQATVCFDTDLLRMSAGWTGGFLKWYSERDGLERHPSIDGPVSFFNEAGPGWSITESFEDPRRIPYGPLPDSWAHYRGLFLHENRVVLSYSVGSCGILELPDFEVIQKEPVFTRTFNLEASSHPLFLRLFNIVGPDPKIFAARGVRGTHIIRFQSDAVNRILGCDGMPSGAEWEILEGHLCLSIPASSEARRFQIYLSDEPTGIIRNLINQMNKRIESTSVPDLSLFCKGGPSRWKSDLKTRSISGNDTEALAVDTLTHPEKNPWNSWMRFGGLDFLSADRAVLCSISGDVWLVSGMAPDSPELSWKRFATGLYQPLGVKVVDGAIYVLGRDQITRFHDYNNDGEADYYENFNNDSMVSENFHEFTLNLETDRDGNFYYTKGAPWPPDGDPDKVPELIKTPHAGILFQLPPDGSELRTYATGLRGPNGLAIGPDGQIVYSDNEGHWLPTCTLQLVRRGGFHGMKPTAFTVQEPTEFEQPICWIPHNVDNSPADPIWVTNSDWGPLHGKMLLSSYGKSNLSLVLTEEVDGAVQGGIINLPLRFQSGLVRTRFNPFDGHLYVCGMRVWQSTGARYGAFHRIRYTGRPLNLPIALNAEKNGMRLTFTCRLDPDIASDPQSYRIEQWNYRWTDRYGSPHYSVKNPEEKGQDEVWVHSVELSQDHRSVFLRTDPLKPVMQMHIAYDLLSEDDQELSHDIYNTIHKLRP